MQRKSSFMINNTIRLRASHIWIYMCVEVDCASLRQGSKPDADQTSSSICSNPYKYVKIKSLFKCFLLLCEKLDYELFNYKPFPCSSFLTNENGTFNGLKF